MTDLPDKTIINIFETIQLILPNGTSRECRVKIDTGAYRSSIDKELAESLGLINPANVVGYVKTKSSLGKHQRQVIEINYLLKDQLIKSTASLSDRSNVKFPMIIGRRDLRNFLIEYKPHNEVELPTLKSTR